MAPQLPPRLPATIWALGFVSLLMDFSSELIHSLLPVFMVGALGISAFTLGLIEGVAEATALIAKVFSGVLSDYLGKRKPLAVLGYGLGALSKPLFALANSAGLVLGARLMDRIGKGLRGAPRDALVAELAPPGMRGAAFGLRQSLDTVGALLGPLLAIGLMLLWANDFHAVFWVAVIPAMLSVGLLILGVTEPEKPRAPHRVNPISREHLRRLPVTYWWVVGLGSLFTLARFSEAFLVLRVQQGGLSLALTPLVLAGMNLIYAIAAYPFGKLADRWPPTRLLVQGLVVLLLADLVLAYGTQFGWLALGIGLWGLHMAMTQGLLAALVARTAPADLLGTAYGMFNLSCGLALLLASAVAGWLWDEFGAATTFLAGGGFCLLSLGAIATPRLRRLGTQVL